MPSRSGHPAGYATTLLGSLGGAISVGLLTAGLFSVIERHPLVFGLGNAPDDVFVLLLVGLVGVGIWVGSVLGSVLLLRWRGTGGVAVTAGLLAVLVPSTIVVVLFTERQLLGDRTSALVTVSLFSVQVRPELVWFGVAWGAVLLLPTLLARALQQLVAARGYGRQHNSRMPRILIPLVVALMAFMGGMAAIPAQRPTGPCHSIIHVNGVSTPLVQVVDCPAMNKMSAASPYLFLLAVIFLSCPAWWYSRERDRWFAWDYGLPFYPLIIWYLASVSRVGATQSLANLVEAPIIVVFTLTVLSLRVFLVDRWIPHYRNNSVVVVLICLAMPIALRLIMPTLPE